MKIQPQLSYRDYVALCRSSADILGEVRKLVIKPAPAFAISSLTILVPALLALTFWRSQAPGIVTFASILGPLMYWHFCRLRRKHRVLFSAAKKFRESLRCFTHPVGELVLLTVALDACTSIHRFLLVYSENSLPGDPPMHIEHIGKDQDGIEPRLAGVELKLLACPKVSIGFATETRQSVLVGFTIPPSTEITTVRVVYRLSWSTDFRYGSGDNEASACQALLCSGLLTNNLVHGLPHFHRFTSPEEVVKSNVKALVEQFIVENDLDSDNVHIDIVKAVSLYFEQVNNSKAITAEVKEVAILRKGTDKLEIPATVS